jgi:hypothetical protein
MAEGEQNWNLSKTKSVLKASKQLKKAASHSKFSILTKTLNRDLSIVRKYFIENMYLKNVWLKKQ